MSYLSSCLHAKKEVQMMEKAIAQESQSSLATSHSVFLPPEMWEQILLVQPQQDLGNLYALYANANWELMLRSKKTTILFPLVLPFLLEYLPTNTILSCRGICKRAQACLNKILDTFSLENELTIAVPASRRDAANLHNVNSIRIKGRVVFTDEMSIETFTQHFLPKPIPLKSSFMLGSIFVDLNENCEAELTAVLNQIGHLIKNIYFYKQLHAFTRIPPGLMSLSKVATVLGQCLGLHSLKIRDTSISPCVSNGTNEIIKFPNLPNLDYLNIKGFSRAEDLERLEESPLLHQYGHQIKTLRVYGHLLDFVSADMLNTLFPNLGSLHVLRLGGNGVRKLSKVTKWRKLEQLHIEPVHTLGAGASVGGVLKKQCKCHESVGTIKLFNKSLVEFYLNLQHFNAEHLELGGVYQKLKKLSIQPFYGDDALNMRIWEVLPHICPKLEELELQLHVELSPDRDKKKAVYNADWRHEAKAKKLFKEIPSLIRIVIWYEELKRVIRRPLLFCKTSPTVGKELRKYWTSRVTPHNI